jgi:16S rRNA processing protein RimM
VPKGRARSAQTQLRVGRLTKAHGLKGGLKLELYTDDPERRFTPGASFTLQVPEESPWHGKRLELAELRWYNRQPVGFFVGVADRTAAESLVKAILWVDQDPSEPAEPDAWYDHQLVGLDVIRNGERVGSIDRLEHLPAQDLLVVDTGDREVLVPFVRAIVPEVDVEARRVVVTPPEGLFEDLPEDDENERHEAGPAESPSPEETVVSDGRSGDPRSEVPAVASDAGSADGPAEFERPIDAAEREDASAANAADQAAMAAREGLVADDATDDATDDAGGTPREG